MKLHIGKTKLFIKQKTIQQIMRKGKGTYTVRLRKKTTGVSLKIIK